MIESALIVDVGHREEPVADADKVDHPPGGDGQLAARPVANVARGPIESAVEGRTIGNIEHRTGQTQGAREIASWGNRLDPSRQEYIAAPGECAGVSRVYEQSDVAGQALDAAIGIAERKKEVAIGCTTGLTHRAGVDEAAYPNPAVVDVVVILEVEYPTGQIVEGGTGIDEKIDAPA